MFKVATFNLQNLNAAGHEFVGRPSDLPHDQREAAAKRRAVADMLTALDADILGFQEVFSEVELTAAVHGSAAMADAVVAAPLAQVVRDASGVPVPGAIDPSSPVSQGPHLGIAMRPAFAGPVRMIAAFPAGVTLTIPAGLHSAVETVHHIGIRRFERPVLRAEPLVPGLPGLVVFVAHLKSKRPKFLAGEDEGHPVVQALGAMRSLVVRAAEAAALKALVAEARSEWVDGRRRPVIVLGDVNDDLDSVTTGMITGERPFPDKDLGGKVERQRFARIMETLLFPAQDLAVAEGDNGTHTYVHQNRPSVIDAILFSADFAPGTRHTRARVREVRVHNRHLKKLQDLPWLPGPAKWSPAARPDPLPGTEPRNRLRPPKLGFDHGVVVATVEADAAA